MVRQSWNAMVSEIVRKSPVRLRRPVRARLASGIEVVESRCLLSSMTLATQPLVYDPTPALPGNGDNVEIGTVVFTRDIDLSSDVITVQFNIDLAHQADYDLSTLETSVSSANVNLGQAANAGLPAGVESFTQQVSLSPLPGLNAPLSIQACATITGPASTGSPTVEAIGASLPSIGTVRLFSGNIIAPSSYFDSIVTPGWIPSSTDTVADTLTFGGSPTWESGDAVRVVAMSGASATTGLITPLTNGNTTAKAYFVHAVGGSEYSFHLNPTDALSGANPVDITSLVPQSGEIIVAAENDALAYLGQVPASQTGNTLTFDQPHGWADGTLVRIAVAMGGLSANANYYVEAVDANTIKLHAAAADVGSGPGISFSGTVSALISPMFNGWCVDFDRPADVGKEQIVNIYSSYEANSFPDSSFDPKEDAGPENGRSTSSVLLTPSGHLSDRLVFSSNHGLPSEMAVRVTTDSGGLLQSSVYYTRTTGTPTTLFLYDTLANATAGGTTGRINYSGTVSTSLYRATSITFSPSVNWPTGTRVKLTANDGGLNTATDYYVRNLSSGASYSFHTSRADALNDNNPIVFSEPIDATTTIYVKEDLVERPENFDMVNWILNQSFQTQTSPSTSTLYSMGDIEAAIWSLLENNPPLSSNPNVAPFTPAHVTEIVALATAAVGGRIDQTTDDFIPGVGQVVAIVMQPINLLEQTSSQVTIAEIPTADIPGYWQYEDCHLVNLNGLQEFGEPSIMIVKSADPEHLPEGGAQQVTYTYAVTNTSDDVGGLVDFDLHDIAVHDTDEDELNAPEYAYGDDGDSLLNVGETWYYTLTVTLPATNATGLSSAAAPLPATASITMTFPGTALNPPSYWQVTINGGALGGVYNAWCIDTDRNLSSGGTYSVGVSSSYSPSAAALFDAGETPENLDLINWVINQNFVGQDAGGGLGAYTYGDVELAIWGLIGDTPTNPGTSYNDDRVAQIISQAEANGENFVPGPGQRLAVILVPNGGQIILAEIPIAPTHTNVVTVTGLTPDEILVQDEDTETVDYFDVAPSILVEKSASVASVQEGGVGSQTVTYSYSVTNTSAAGLADPLHAITISDTDGTPEYTGGDNGDGVLQSGETWHFTLTVTLPVANAGAEHQNLVTVTGTDDEGNLADDQDVETVTYTNVAPQIDVTKAVSATSVLEGTAGQEVDYTYTVKNVSPASTDSELTLTELTDDKIGDLLTNGSFVGGDTDNDEKLDVGETWTFVVSGWDMPVQNAGATETNVVTATGTDDEGSEATDTASQTVAYTNLAPQIEVTKAASTTTLYAAGIGNQQVTYTYTVTNLSPAGIYDPLSEVSLSDTDGTPALDSKTGGDTDDLLEAGEVWIYKLTTTLTAQAAGTSHTNTVTATGKDDEGNPATDTTTATVSFVSGLSSLSGFVYVDTNNDGVFQGTETPISGVIVKLTGTDDLGAVSLTGTTTSTGYYEFTDLRPGTYQITETQPAAYADGKDTIGTPGGTTANDVFSDIAVVPVINGINNNFGERGGSIGGTKYLDVTGNGLTNDDTPLQGATFKLYRDSNNSGKLDTGDSYLQQTTSGVDGKYSFGNLPAGVYFVKEVVMDGYVRTGPTLSDNYKITLTAGGSSNCNDFANAEVGCQCAIDTSSIRYYINGSSSFVTDLRGKVNQGDTVEVRFNVTEAGSTFSLVSYTAPGASFDANTAWKQAIFDTDILTNATVGAKSLKVLVPNSYFQIDFVCGLPIDKFGPAGSNVFYTPQGRLISADNDGTRAYATSSLSGYVYRDNNNDGNKGSSEPGINNVTITLTGIDITGASVSLTTKTNSSGYYSFTGLKASDTNGYRISESQPSSFNDGKDTLGSLGGSVFANDKLKTRQLNSNSTGTGYNFGERPLPQLIAGAVYEEHQAALLTPSGISTGEFQVAVVDSTPDQLARVQDAIAGLNSQLGQFNVHFTLVTGTAAATAPIQIRLATTSDLGGQLQGVLGATSGGDVTLISGWNWFVGANPATIQPGQYDFQTVVAHELAHTVGLGESSDPTSVMYQELAAGQVRRSLSSADLLAIASVTPVVPTVMTPMTSPGRVLPSPTALAGLFAAPASIPTPSLSAGSIAIAVPSPSRSVAPATVTNSVVSNPVLGSKPAFTAAPASQDPATDLFGLNSFFQSANTTGQVANATAGGKIIW